MENQKEIRLDLLRSIFRPAVRFCLRHSISLHEVLNSIRKVFIDLAVEEIKRGENKITVSRISVMTGMSRREVKNIYQEGKPSKGQTNLATRVIGQWEHDEDFLTKAGKPRALLYKGENSEFKTLVERVSKDVNPASVLFELQRLNAVKFLRNRIVLERSIFYLFGDPEKSFKLLSRDTETLARVVEENLFSPGEIRNLHLRTEYDNIFQEDVAEIRKWIHAQGTLFHKRIRDYLARHDKDLNPDRSSRGGARVVVGAFTWTDEDGDE